MWMTSRKAVAKGGAMGAIAPPQLGQKLNFTPKTSQFLRVLDTKCKIFSRLRRETSKNAYFTENPREKRAYFLSICAYMSKIF